jgi:PAS domain-containing protein
MAAPHRKPARLLSGLGATRAAVRRRLRPAAVPAPWRNTTACWSPTCPTAVISLYDRDLVGVVVEGPMLKREGYTSEDFVGRRLVDSLGPADLAVFEPLFRAALDGRRGMIEYLSPRSQVLYEMEIVPQVSASGTVVGAFSVARDVTAARQAHRAADQVVASFEAIFNAAPIGVLILSSDGAGAAREPRHVVAGGIRRRRTARTAFARLIHPEDVPKLERELAALAAGESGRARSRFAARTARVTPSPSRRTSPRSATHRWAGASSCRSSTPRKPSGQRTGCSKWRRPILSPAWPTAAASTRSSTGTSPTSSATAPRARPS